MSFYSSYETIKVEAVDSQGFPSKFLSYLKNFDCTKRLCYATVAARLAPTWTSPFLFSNGIPGISYVIPLQNMTYAGESGFIGALSFDLQLNKISAFLWKIYGSTSTIVYIMDKSSGYLIANSLRAPTVQNFTTGEVVRLLNFNEST